MLDRKQVIDLAEDAGLVFNTEVITSGYKVTPRHGAALWKFYKLLKAEFEKELETKEGGLVFVDAPTMQNTYYYRPEGEQDEKDN